MSEKLPRCEICGRAFRPDRYNAWHQKHCGHPGCARERRRACQRRSYARRKRDAKFRAAENARCAEANRRRRAQAKLSEVSPAEPPLVERPPAFAELREVSDVLTGVLSQLLDTDDPILLRRAMTEYGDRGRRATVPDGNVGF